MDTALVTFTTRPACCSPPFTPWHLEHLSSLWPHFTQASIGNGGDVRGLVVETQVEVRRRHKDVVHGVVLGIVLEAVREADHGLVVRLQVGVPDGARLTLR
jgi:hypothetical protein